MNPIELGSDYFEVQPGVWKITDDAARRAVGDRSNLYPRKRWKFCPADVPALLASVTDHRFKTRALSRPDQRTSGGYVKIKAYAADRLTLCAGRSAPLGGCAAKWKLVRPRVYTGSGDLMDTAKLDAGWKIGNRRRSRPQATRLTRLAKNMVCDAAHVIERDTTGDGWFVTLTIAGGTQAGYDVMSAASGYIVDRFNRWIRYKVQNGWFVYVWELQDRGAPHLHYMFRCADKTDKRALELAVQAEWRKIVLDVSGESGVDLFARAVGGTWRDDPSKPFVSARRIWGNMAGYLSKYLSKTRSKGGKAHRWHPGRWTGVSYPLRQEVQNQRVDIVLEFASEGEARRALTMLVSRAVPALTSVFRCQRAQMFGALVVSADTFVRQSKVIALALAALALDGDCTPLAEVVSAIQTAA